MSLHTLTLGERMVLAMRMLTVEHIRQEADAAGLDLSKFERAAAVAERVDEREVAAIRQDLFRQPVEDALFVDEDGDDGRRVA